MKFRIPIYPEIHIENSAILWKHQSGDVKSRMLSDIGLGAIIVYVAAAPPWPFAIKLIIAFLGLAYIARIVYAWILSYQNRKEYLLNAALHYISKDEMIVEYTEDHFSYFDTQYTATVPWGQFTSCFVKKDVLFLIGDDEVFMISKKVMYAPDFNEMTAFILKRTKRERSEITRLLNGETGWY